MIEKLIEEIEKGNLIITPTDTVYGISADATNIEAIKKVFEAKKRENKPLLILVSSIDMLKEYVSEINEVQEKLMNYWPDKLTILFKKNDKVNDLITCGSEYIGIRIPDNKLLLYIINKIKKPLISTSANISGEPVITNTTLINDELKKYISYILDDGEKPNVSSTLLKVDNNKIIFLREGEIATKIKNEFKEYI